jgi:hypothetical protein
MEQTSRIELARHRLRIARRAIGVVAAAGFVAFVFAARASHPGSSTKPGAPTADSSASAVPATSEQDDFGFDFGQGSVAPSTGGTAPLQSGGS